jgi:uncharacterized protein (UPF0332 family)
MPNFNEELKQAGDDYNQALLGKQIEKDNKHSVFAPAYANFAENSLATAGILYDLSKDDTKRAAMKVEDSYNGYMWVVVSAYFSMFYMASALLAKKGIKIGRVDTHKYVKSSFLHVYIANHFLENALGIEYMEAKKLAEDLMAERKNRSKYQYNVGNKALEADAELSLKRARNFFQKTRQMVK